VNPPNQPTIRPSIHPSIHHPGMAWHGMSVLVITYRQARPGQLSISYLAATTTTPHESIISNLLSPCSFEI